MPALPPGPARGEAWFAQSLRRIRLTLAYDGTAFHGWQVQPGQVTIQGELEAVLGRLEGAPVKVHGSGRTDTGVHALGQVAAYTSSNPLPLDNLRRAANHLLPESIRVLDAAEAALEFQPRFDATAKTYEYRIWRTEICPPFDRPYVHHYPYPLSEAAIIAAAPLLEGEHDFSAFAASDERDDRGHSKVRRIFSSRCQREGNLLIYRVRGTGFLKHMVRNIVGTLREVGKGNLSAEDLRRLLTPAGHCAATAPASGLFLVSVEY